MKDKFYQYIQVLQDKITSKLEAVDGKAQFKEDLWERPEGGGGRTRVIENGAVFEKGGVNISGVHGKLPKSMQAYFNVGEVDFFACGLSLVLHPKNPMVPTVHANWRYFEMYDSPSPSGKLVGAWFGGGQDLTPYYLFEEDNSFLDAYVPIVEKRKDLPFTEAQRNWQEIRRGRYVEFNLVHDKGTLFGLKTNGRIESILMSLPPHVQWVYNHQPEAGSEEEKLIEVLKHPKNWV